MRIIAEADGTLQELEAHAFGNEGELQDVLEEWPGLVLAAAPDDESVRVWTIGREVPVPSGSVDLVLLDSTGRVWVVEVKLAKNPEVRKQVVGQVLAYCADAARWSQSDLEDVADQYLEPRAASLRELLREAGEDPDALLDAAETRLAGGDVIGLVVVDELNAVLKNVVDFVNGHARFGLLAMKVEVVPHAGSRLFIPTVVGLTQPSASGTSKLTFEDAMASADPPLAEVWERLQSLAAGEGWTLTVKRRTAECTTADERTVFWFTPFYRRVQYFVGALADRGHQAEVEEFLAMLDRVAGTPVTRRSPQVPIAGILQHWEVFVEATRLRAVLAERLG
jgi:hypothetical protein